MRKTVILVLAATFTAVAMASGGVQVYKFEFDGDSGPVSLELNSQTMGFGLDDLQPGDTRTTVTEDGAAITVSRNDETIELEVGGNVFAIPARHGPPHAGDARMERRHVMMSDGPDDGLTVISKNPLDESRQATIRAALSAAGIVEEVRFLSPGSLGGGEEIVIEHDIEDDGEGERVIVKRIVID